MPEISPESLNAALLESIREIAGLTTGFDTEEMIAEIQGVCRRALAMAEGRQ